MSKKLKAILFIVFWSQVLNAVAGTERPNAWILQYSGKSTNKVRIDSRLDTAIQMCVPKELSETLLDSLSGPPDPVFSLKDRFVSMSACVAHYCPMKGFFWLDVERNACFGAVWGDEYKEPDRLKLASNDIPSDEIPIEAMQALKKWMYTNDLHPKKVVYIGKAGVSSLLNADKFQPPVKFMPPTGGPSFDCLKANGLIEKTICGNVNLSVLDLLLHDLFYEIKNGHAELAAQDELVSFQRAWIKDRNKRCNAAMNVVLCLDKSYREQERKLKNWLPKST